jgi:hypothetical protein|tara:strand:- start:2648 stop:3235 length:588 start_codon:yes stop_codon:yes gene_type:complete
MASESQEGTMGDLIRGRGNSAPTPQESGQSLASLLKVNPLTASVTTDAKFRLPQHLIDRGLGKRWDQVHFNETEEKFAGPNYKGMGYAGRLRNAGGSDMTEWSQTGSLYGEGKGGPLIEYPLIVPGMDSADVRWMLSRGYLQLPRNQFTESDQASMGRIERVAQAHARKRIEQGLSPFASAGEEDRDLYRGLSGK